VGEEYQEVGQFGGGSQVASLTLPGFVVDVTAVFAAGNFAVRSK
jgi:hypothetical protein